MDFSKIDFKQVRSDKQHLINIRDSIKKDRPIQNIDLDCLTGVIHLIDFIQDEACLFNISEKEVFNL